MGPSEALFITQVVVLLLVGRLLGEAMQRIGQPAVMGQLVAVVLLGPRRCLAGACRARAEGDARGGFRSRDIHAPAADRHDLAFFRFPNLRNLVVDFRGTEHFFSLSYEVHSGQPIVSTELIAYTLGTPLPLWLSRRIGKSCRNLGFIYFKGVLAKYSRDVSPFLRHFRERRRTSLIDQRAKTSWEALLSGRGGNHFIFFDETFYKGEIRDSGWQLRRSFQPPSTPGDITGLQIAENGDIYMTTFNEEERKEFDSSGFWTGSDSRVATSSKNAEFWELIRIDDWLRGS